MSYGPTILCPMVLLSYMSYGLTIYIHVCPMIILSYVYQPGSLGVRLEFAQYRTEIQQQQSVSGIQPKPGENLNKTKIICLFKVCE